MTGVMWVTRVTRVTRMTWVTSVARVIFVGSNIELGEGVFFPKRHRFGNSFVE